MTVSEHAATKRVFEKWRIARTGSLTGDIQWGNVTPREMNTLTEAMLQASEVPKAVRDAYMRALNRYLYTGTF